MTSLPSWVMTVTLQLSIYNSWTFNDSKKFNFQLIRNTKRNNSTIRVPVITIHAPRKNIQGYQILESDSAVTWVYDTKHAWKGNFWIFKRRWVLIPSSLNLINVVMQTMLFSPIFLLFQIADIFWKFLK